MITSLTWPDQFCKLLINCRLYVPLNQMLTPINSRGIQMEAMTEI